MTNPDIEPEHSKVIELEAGYQFTPEMLFSVNAFRIRTKNNIIYQYDFLTEESNYYNAERSGSSGLEAEYKMRYKWGYLNLGYSFYKTISKSTVEDFKVAENKNVYIGFPAHKLTLNGSLKAWKGLRVNPSIVWASARYGYNTTVFPEDEEGEQEFILNKVPSYALVNLFINYENLFLKGLTAGIGVYDIFEERPSFIQPYNGSYSPLPGPGREFILKLTYNLSFNNQ